MESHPPTIVAPFGAKARINRIDIYGFTGRDLHPTRADEGRVGVIVKNSVELYEPPPPREVEIARLEGNPSPSGDIEIKTNVEPGTLLDPELATVCYEMLFLDGDRLELMDFELEFVR